MAHKLSIDDLVNIFNHISGNRYNWETLWQESADFCLPQKAIITNSRAPGEKLNTQIYDSTAQESVPRAAAGIHNLVTNPNSRWFGLRMRNKALNENQDVKDWLRNAEDTVYDVLNNSNFNEVVLEWYIDFLVFGSPTLYEESDVEDVVRFFVRPPQEIYFLVNEAGRIDTVYRRFTITARQAHLKWGDNVGAKVLKLVEAGKLEELVTFMHVVLPREERDVRKRDARNMPFASIYIEPSNKKKLSEGGFEEFPFFIPRFYKVSDSEYAYCPASISLANNKMLNAMSKTTIKGAQKELNPVLILPSDGYMLPFKQTAGALNFKLSTDPNDKVEALPIKRNFAIGLDMEAQRRKAIKEAFFIDLFLMLANLPERDRTAFEINARVNEQISVLGPALGRLMKSLGGIVVRTLAEVTRRNMLPDPPEAIQGQDFKIDYLSFLAKAQRASEGDAIVSIFEIAKSMAEVDETVMHNLKLDKMIKDLGDIRNVAPDLFNSEEEVAEIREIINQQQQVQNALAESTAAGEAVTKIAEVSEALKGGEKK